MPEMSLRELVKRLPVDPHLHESLPDVTVTGAGEDSRAIEPGDIFVARQGHGVDGKQFVAQAVERGAVAVVSDDPIDDPGVPHLTVPDAGAATSIFASALAGDPSKRLKVLGVTGTNGKTTTAFLLRHLLQSAGKTCGLIGTCEIDDGQTIRVATMTTPGPVELAKLLATMTSNGCDAVAMEVSSHALDQGRAAGIEFAAAGFTNLSGDHLDYHRTMDDYASAKAKLFMNLPETAAAVVNCGDEWTRRMLEHTKGRPTPFSVGGDCHSDFASMYVARDIVSSDTGSTFVLHTPDGHAEVRMKLVGRHNVQNAVCAAAMAGEVFGLSVHQLATGLAGAEGAPGRLQRVEAGQPFTILVDYAHTDDALANVLSALKPVTKGKLRVVFGCGGDRDRAKRPRMAQVAENFADELYITSDNPRTEDPDKILEEIVAGLTSKRPAMIEADRRAAIFAAVADCGPDDVLLIAGKGHEDYQILGTEKIHFDDVEEAKAAVAGAGVS